MEKEPIIPSNIIHKGDKYGLLTAIEFHHTGNNHAVYWVFSCGCGNEIVTRVTGVKAGHAKSCGCYQRDVAKRSSLKHGGVSGGGPSRLYRTWISMIERCRRTSTKCYHRYGGRGISVCDEWKDYRVFEAWSLSNGYANNLFIDRIDNDGNYEPSNCRWATLLENAGHTSKTHAITVDGETHCAAEWARRIGTGKRNVAYWSRKHGTEYAATKVKERLCELNGR